MYLVYKDSKTPVIVQNWQEELKKLSDKEKKEVKRFIVTDGYGNEIFTFGKLCYPFS